MQSSVRPGVTHRRARPAWPSASSAPRAPTPTFKGYRGFPGSICASPNAMIVHGIPGPYRLAEGDIISIDVGVTLDGWVADAARTFPVGEIARGRETCSRATEASLHAGVAQCVPGNRMGDVSSAIQRVAEGAGLVGRALAGRPRRRAQHARGPAGAQLRQARQGAAARGGHGARDRADDDRRAARRCGWAATAGRSSPRTARRPPTSSSPSRSPPTGPRVLTPWHLPAAERTRGAARRASPAPAERLQRRPARDGLRRTCYHLESCPSARLFCLRRGMSTTR